MVATTLELNFDRRLEVVTAGLPGEFSGLLQNKISRDDALTIMDYMKAMRKEIREEMTEQLAHLVTQLKPEVLKQGLVNNKTQLNSYTK
jgi:flagellar biosynthesis/type III secretory pathway protein FliH